MEEQRYAQHLANLREARAMNAAQYALQLEDLRNKISEAQARKAEKEAPPRDSQHVHIDRNGAIRISPQRR
jgi:hypothetical protein